METGADITLKWVGDRCLRIGLGSGTSEAEHRRVRAAYERVRGAGLADLVDVTAAYSSLLLTFDAMRLEPRGAMAGVESALRGLNAEDESAVVGRRVEIPVCYAGEFASDIDDVAQASGLSAAEVAVAHAGAEYTVRFIGFSPGFAYLGGLPERLNTPRLARPRVRVPAGSIGIAGDQTGIYPLATPGGWRLIGRTPLRMFDTAREPAAFLSMGDRVRFVAIDAAEFVAMVKGGG